MIQGSDEWLQARIGKVTASRVHDIIATTRSGGYTAGRKNYMAELVWERLTGELTEHYVSPAMILGSEKEPKARFAYTLERGVEVEQVGFITHPTIPNAGASPDGLVGDGLIEIKVPNGAQHLSMLLGDKIDPPYISQMMWQMACLPDRKWCDFVSYHDNAKLSPKAQLNIRRLKRDDTLIAKMELEVTQFLIDLDATVDLVRKRYP